NGDSRLDIIAVGQDGASVLLNTGTGTFASKVNYATGNFPTGVAVGDLNGDGAPDIATSNQSADTMSILINNGDGT
ncbi:MAG TPA: VCBS repeat-containing protein, partial [Candidatus Woesebacteria bacterium]|nr:VCBS repeat-containing protein [Candidatus Woesebacteria bacterium]